MKKLFLLFTIIILVLLVPVSAFGAIHLPADTYATTDTWFTIEPDPPYLEAHYRTSGTGYQNQELGYQSYRNEQSFFAFNFDLPRNSEIDTYYLSFLTGFGLFAGIYLESNNVSNGFVYDKMIYSPGFRLSLDDLSYIAISVDYLTINYNSNLQYDDQTNELADFEINLKYYDDNMRLFGNYKSYTDVEYGESYLSLGANYQVLKPLVVGASLVNTKSLNRILVGGTFKIKPIIIDGQFILNSFSSGSSMNQLTVSGMFLLGNYIKIGAEYYKSSLYNDGYLTVKATAGGQKTSFILKYGLKNNTYAPQVSLSFKHQR